MACDEKETVEHRWLSPSAAVAETEGGTFCGPADIPHAHRASHYASGLDAMQAALNRDVHPIMPKLDISDGQWTVVLPGDPSYPTQHPVEGPTKVEFGRSMVAMLTTLVGVALAALTGPHRWLSICRSPRTASSHSAWSSSWPRTKA